ncbi:ATP-binding cassette domain-containing protein [Hyunsoonleella ulvae]|uniref:ATP-binding cassette domain-containing protein n=1 Tax=Hyunsoonleella ulvae TaxID=2799948 RepID=UPI00193A9136|nr:ABC transporter ATP-binding protein [Hyunsoonleella ulvae]
MDKQKKRLNDVYSFLDNEDTELGFRKLMDCAIDTQNMEIYNDVITLTDWKTSYETDKAGLIKKSKTLLDKISAIPIETYKKEAPVISAANVTKKYPGSHFELGPVSLNIHKGEVYGLVGENGNGKTTLLRLLAKELKLTSGSLDYNLDINTNSTYDLRCNLVYIPQRTKQWYGSLIDNLKFVLSNYGISEKENETRVLMMIARFGLWGYKNLKWSELSSGYKMRFELARTMLRQPELLLLDEPLANLDVLAQQVILEDLKSICNSITNPVALILSSQQLYEVEKVSDKVIYLKNGKYEADEQDTATSTKQLIVEIDCNCDRDTLLNTLSNLNLETLVFNGGIFIAYFSEKTPYYSVLEALGKQKVEVTYSRNISNSTRRFFIS